MQKKCTRPKICPLAEIISSFSNTASFVQPLKYIYTYMKMKPGPPKERKKPNIQPTNRSFVCPEIRSKNVQQLSV